MHVCFSLFDKKQNTLFLLWIWHLTGSDDVQHLCVRWKWTK